MISSTIELEQHGNLVVATISTSYMTHPEMQELIEMLQQKMRYDNANHFVLDMTTVAYLSSACIGELVAFLQDLEHVRGRIALANCQPDVAFLFRVTRLDTVFSLCADVNKAKEHLNPA